MSEAMALAEKHGVDRKEVMSMLTADSADGNLTVSNLIKLSYL